jgi:hypothetical protein
MAGYFAMAGLIAVAWALGAMLKNARGEIKDLRAETVILKAEVARREGAIKKMQEAYHEADKKKKSIRSGEPAADFQRSIDLLRDVPGESGAD